MFLEQALYTRILPGFIFQSLTNLTQENCLRMIHVIAATGLTKNALKLTPQSFEPSFRESAKFPPSFPQDLPPYKR